ncbi:MAG TPA: TIGR01777 family oxidoreductase [Solirubrobacteraceae bacterium]|nr:TIGR01777 family oxidoreductase [Solirubrobacteraceae bacterium]
MPESRPIAISGASGLIGRAITAALLERGTSVSVLSRSPERAREALGALAQERISYYAWDGAGPAPAQALAGARAVIHLAGERIDQRWSSAAKRRIHDSRVQGTRNLVEGIRALSAEQRPETLLCASAIGYYGARGSEPLDEEAAPGEGFLAEVCRAWEESALSARELGLRVVCLRTGVVLDAREGALARMLTPFRAGLGGPIGSGRQYISWIHREDVAGLYLSALEDQQLAGALNATAPHPATNAQFTRALARALHRPALLPIPPPALRLLYGEMATLLTTGARVVPARALVAGFEFRHPELPGALAAALSRQER